MMNQVRTRSVPGESMQRFLQATEDVEKTAARWHRSNTHLMISAMAGNVLIAAVTYGLLAFSQVHFMISSMVIAYLFSTIGFANILYRGIRDLRNAGPVLLDCGKIKTRSIEMFLISVLLFAGMIFMSNGTKDINLIYVAAAIAMFLPISLYFLAVSRGYLQVRANGIWHYIGFLPWHKIESWGWSGPSESTLLIQKNGRIPFLNRGVLSVPPEMKEEFEDYLQQNCVSKRSASVD